MFLNPALEVFLIKFFKLLEDPNPGILIYLSKKTNQMFEMLLSNSFSRLNEVSTFFDAKKNYVVKNLLCESKNNLMFYIIESAL